jgi:hypothetical protein
MWVASGTPELGFPGKAFVAFCKKRYQMKPNPVIFQLSAGTREQWEEFSRNSLVRRGIS